MGAPVNISIDPDLDSAAYIFDVVFECKARNLDLITDNDLRDFGSFATGMEMLDNDNMTQMVSANMNIVQMAKHASRGYTLRFVHAQDVLKVYEFTQNHLQRWASNVERISTLNGGGAPLDDLVELDVFCSKIYEQAKYYDEAKLNSIDQRFGTSMGFSAIKSMFRNKNQDVDEKLENLSTSHRKGFSELFNDLKMRKSGGFASINTTNLNG